jgi:ABC-type sulfate/molybdate transport systems ATPase subunit
VALARAIAPEPRLLLLDEPFASLDRPARVQLGGVLRDVLARHGIPGVLVTHDAEEAAALGDAVLRFERGRGVETVDPRELVEGSWVLRGQVIREGGVGGRDRVRVEGALDVPAGALPDGEVAITLRRG